MSQENLPIGRGLGAGLFLGDESSNRNSRSFLSKSSTILPFEKYPSSHFDLAVFFVGYRDRLETNDARWANIFALSFPPQQ